MTWQVRLDINRKGPTRQGIVRQKTALRIKNNSPFVSSESLEQMRLCTPEATTSACSAESDRVAEEADECSAFSALDERSDDAVDAAKDDGAVDAAAVDAIATGMVDAAEDDVADLSWI